MPRRLPSVEHLKQLHSQGVSNYEIGEQYGTTAEAVRIALKRAGVSVERSRADHSHYLPWKLRADHTHDTLARRLRLYSKWKQGGQLTAEEMQKLQKWMEFMDGDNPTGLPLSVHYDRLDRDGFWLEARVPGDRDYIHPPIE